MVEDPNLNPPPGHSVKVIFSTSRLSVRHWAETDLELVKSLYSHPSVIRWVDDGQPITSDEAVAWMKKTKANYVKYGYGMFAIDEIKSFGTLGFGGIVHPNGQKTPEIKYAFKPDCWGLGLATEFVNGLMNYAIETLHLTEVIATISPQNEASRNVLLKSNFEFSHALQNEDGTVTDVYSNCSIK